MSADTRTVSFLDLLRGTARRCGLDPATLANEEAAALAEHLTMATRTAWQHYDWPDITPTEQRQFRPSWSNSANYQTGDEVYDPASTSYYRALQASTNQPPTTAGVVNAAYWQLPDDFRYNIDFISTGQTTIGEVLGVWSKDPDKHADAVPIGFHLTPTALVCDRLAVRPLVYVRFRLPAPKFSTTAWASGTVYNAGDVVFSGADCWLALNSNTNSTPTSSNLQWRVQTLPALLENSVKMAAKGEWLLSEDQDEKGSAVLTVAGDLLDAASATISDQQGQTRTYAVRTRTRGRHSYAPRRLSS